jgi:hypothetical protein
MKFFLIHRKRQNMLKKFWDKFTDDLELIRFKLSTVMILMIFGLWYLGGM